MPMSPVTRQLGHSHALARLHHGFPAIYGTSVCSKRQIAFAPRQASSSVIPCRHTGIGIRERLRRSNEGLWVNTQFKHRHIHIAHNEKSLNSTSLFTIFGSTEDELLRSLEDLKATSLQLNGHANVTVLLTSSLASSFQPNSPTLLRLLSSAFHTAHKGASIDVFTVIVDELPYPAPGNGTSSHSPKIGLSGISVAIETSNAKSSDLQESRIDPDIPDRSIRFSFNTIDQHHYNDASPVRYSHTVTLPLPNMIFETGHEAAINKFRLTVKSIGSTLQIKELEATSPEWLPSITMDLSRFTNSPERQLRVENHHIHQLTPFREVTRSMGNVLSGLLGDSRDDRPLPASHELELALRKETNLNFEVWAEVIPSERWSGKPHRISEMDSAIGRGHQFYRVQSGGGGWGARAGLLSLLPPPTFFSIATQNADSQTQPPPLVADVVRHGDIVRFLRVDTSREQDAESDLETSTQQPFANVSKGGRTFTFGTSSLKHSDDMPSPSSSHIHGRTIIPGLFGALSHHPAALVTDSFTAEGNAALGALTMGRVTQSLLPPASRLWCGQTQRARMES